MNGIEKIAERIREDASREIEEITMKAGLEAAEITTAMNEAAGNEYRDIVSKGRAAAAERVLRLGGVAELESRKMVLASKQEMLSRAFSMALKELRQLPGDEYAALLSKLAADASGSGSEEVLLSESDRAGVGENVVSGANRLLTERGRPASLTLSAQTREISGGLYLIDGKLEINCSLETLVNLAKDDLSGEVAAVLFD